MSDTGMTAEMLTALQDAALAAVCDTQAGEPIHYFSTAGDPCHRALAYDLRKGSGSRPPRELKHALSMTMGYAVGEMLEAGARKLGWPTQEKVTLRNGSDFSVSGSLDVRPPGFVLDLKLVGEKSWKRVQHAANDKHVFQVNGYATAANEPRWALAYLRGRSIFDPGELEWRIFRGQTDRARGLKVLGVWEGLYALHAKGEIPPRPPDFARDRFPCGWNGGGCAHRETCWGTDAGSP